MMALLASLLVLTSTPSSKEQQAAELARKSMTEYNVGRFDAALEDATNAYMLDARPGFLYNIGQCHRALHNWERAEFFYRGYLRDKSDAANRKAVEELIAEMQAKQKEEAAAKAKPAEAPIIVEAPANPAPAVAFTAPAEPPPHHGHALAIGLGSAGVVLLAFTVVAIADVQIYNADLSAAVSKPGSVTYSSGANTAAKFFQTAQWVGGALTIAAFTSAALTW